MRTSLKVISILTFCFMLVIAGCSNDSTTEATAANGNTEVSEDSATTESDEGTDTSDSSDSSDTSDTDTVIDEVVTINETDYYTFDLVEGVTRESITYKNKFGVTVAGDIYYPSDMDQNEAHAALVVGGPYGAVKEQAAGFYANQMAGRGYVALAFDPSFIGESGGESRNLASPEFFVEDFSAGVDFLGTLDYVDRESIGAIGVCGSGGFALTAAQVDTHIKAVATASMYDISSFIRDGIGYMVTEEQLQENLVALNEQRWVDFENGGATVGPARQDGPVDEVPEGLPPVAEEYFYYYSMERGYHPNSPNSTVGFTRTSQLGFINFPLLNYVDDISPRPILLIAGENAHSLYYSEEVYEEAGDEKELLIVPGANHVDLYDSLDLIPFDRIESFFGENL